MRALILRRILALIPLLLIVSFGIFLLQSLLPGSPAIALAGGVNNATPAKIAQVTREYHLNEPLIAQYWHWLTGVIAGNFGNSLYGGGSVSGQIASRLPVTLELVVFALIVALLVGVPCGVLASLRPNGFRDSSIRLGTSVAISIPGYWLAIELIVLFSVKLKWLPAEGYVPFTQNPGDWFRSMILPAVALGVFPAAVLSRQLRATMVDTFGSKYIRTAWAKGGSSRTAILKHAGRNAAIPPITILGVQAVVLLGGTVIVEQIFSLPGLGSYFVTAVSNHDVPVIQGVTLVFAVTAMVISLLTDVLYGLVDPRVRIS